MRDPARIARITGLLAEAWEQNPDIRLGQLMSGMLQFREPEIWQIEDDVWERKLRWLASHGFGAAQETK